MTDEEFPTDPEEIQLTQLADGLDGGGSEFASWSHADQELEHAAKRQGDAAELSLQDSSPLTQPATNTQASQDALLADRSRLGRRYARFQMACNSGRHSKDAKYDYNWDVDETLCGVDEHGSHISTRDLRHKVLSTLRRIPDEIWRNKSRPNVRPSNQSTSLQISLGLITSASWRKIPMPSSQTWHFLNLTRLINMLLARLAKEQGLEVPLEGSTMQLTKNLESKLHRDKNNLGASFITGVGDWTGGQTFIEDLHGDVIIRLFEDIPQIGTTGAKIQGRMEQIRDRLVPFDGNKIHGTCPFVGERYAIILYCLGTQSFYETPTLVRLFLQELGFTLPDAPSEPITQQLQDLAMRAARGERVGDQLGRHKPPRGNATAAAALRGEPKQQASGNASLRNNLENGDIVRKARRGEQHGSKRARAHANETEVVRATRAKKNAEADSRPPQQCLGRWFRGQGATPVTASAPGETFTSLCHARGESSADEDRNSADRACSVALAVSTDLPVPIALGASQQNRQQGELADLPGEASGDEHGNYDDKAASVALAVSSDLAVPGALSASQQDQQQSEAADPQVGASADEGRISADSAAAVAPAASGDLPGQQNEQQSKAADARVSAAKLSADRVERSSKFEGGFHDIWQHQYNGIYKLRLDQLREPVEREARNRWGATLSPQRFLPSLAGHFEPSSGGEVVLIGIIRKDMKDRPGVIQDDHHGQNFSTTDSKNFCSDSDTVWLEDCCMRLRLELHPALADRLATGLVVAARGRASASGIFRISDLCLAWVPEPHQPGPKLETCFHSSLSGSYVAFLSGLAFGKASQGLAAARRNALDFLLARCKMECCKHRPYAVRHVVICGGLLASEALAAGSQDALDEADALLAQLASRVSVDIMPGRPDPSNQSLPQMPLSKKLFRRLSVCDGAKFVTNPVEFSLDAVQFLGHSGQPVEDFLRCTRLPRSKENTLEALKTCLGGLHLAPTAPDTLETRPFSIADPFVIDKVPHVLFSGGHSEAASCWSSSSSGAGRTQCICVPAFHLQSSVVLVNLSDPKDIMFVQDFEDPPHCPDDCARRI
eukprot:TRINITY_DN88555_c0_g1_i1.p1 TRINITY_DN88555_c0_g1~~TRINITY_DN88555_c0_g1_i1.p1  ORF type:complete len:1066 (-),score=192.38 TRINITY_DN88555_c0_g1_i1:153-3350(-)